MSDPQPALCFGELVIDLDARTVSLAGASIELTRREFDILATLAGHPRWVYSAETLATADPAFDGSPSSVNVQVARVRKKLARGGCQALIETVRGVGYRLNPDHVLSGPGSGARPEPFVGRSRELESLSAAFSAATHGDSRFVLVTGEAGIGKTRCAEEFSRSVAEQGGEVLWGRSVESGAPPYWPWVQILRGVTEDEPSPSGDASSARARDALLDQLLPGLLGTAPVRPDPAQRMPPQESTFLLFDSVTRLLADVSRARPLVLVLDDLQWSSAESLGLLEFAARQLGAARVLIVGLSRDDEGAPPALERVLGECAGRRQTACFKLGGLNADEVASLAASSGAFIDEPELAEAVCRRTGGNALFISELLQMLSSAGAAEHRRPGDLELLMPTPNMRNLVRSRLALLSHGARELVGEAAVLGSEFSLPVLERMGEATRDPMLDELGEAIDAGILIPAEQPDQLRFRHALVQQVVYLETPAATRIRWHGRAGDVLADVPDAGMTDERVAAVASHYREAVPGGYARKAAQFALVSGRRAMRQTAFSTATDELQYARSVVDVENDVEWHAGFVGEVDEALGDALVASARLADAIAAYRAALAATPDAHVLVGACLLTKLAMSLTEMREWDDALASVNEAASKLEAVPEGERDDAWCRVWVDAELKRLWLYYYELLGSEMEERLLEKGQLIEECADPGQLAEYFSVTVLWRVLCDGYWPTDDTVSMACRGYDVATLSAIPPLISTAETMLAFVLLWNGRVAEAREHFDAALPVSEKFGAFTPVMIALAGLTCADRIEGDIDAVRESAARCEAKAQTLGGWTEFGAMGTANLAWAAWRGGDLGEARILAHAAFDAWERAQMYPYKWTAAWPLIAVELAEQDAAAAIACARTLFAPGAQAPRGELASVVTSALEAADAGDETKAAAGLRHAVELGRVFGYT